MFKRLFPVCLLILTAGPSPAMEPYRAGEIQVYRGNSVKPLTGEAVRPDTGDSLRHRPAPATHGESPSVRSPGRKPSDHGQGLVGLWQTNVPGAVYTTPSGIVGYDVLHVSSGAAAGLLEIRDNGTYTWNSYGGKRGAWVRTGDQEYPVEIIDTVENRRWKVGPNRERNGIVIWDGSIWYEGKKAAVNKKRSEER